MLEEIIQKIEEMEYPLGEISMGLREERIKDSGGAAAYGFGEAQERIVEIIRSHSNDGWISCSEEMPEYGKPVLVCDKKGNVCVRAIAFERKGEKYWSQDKHDVIAWRPLPEPYRPQKSVGEDYKQQIMDRFMKTE